VKTAGRRQSPRYALHLGVAANEKIFHSSLSRDPDFAIKRLSLTDYREFYASDERFQKLITDHPSKETCPSGHQRQIDGAYCPICGKRFEIDQVIESLLNDPPDKLSITNFLIQKVIQHFQVKTIKDVLHLTESQLQEVSGIGPIRARIITNAAEEYISG